MNKFNFLNDSSISVLFEKNNKKIFVILFCIFFALLMFQILTVKNQGQDSSWYIALGKNLAEHGSYSLEGRYSHSQYPPGFPLLIAAFYPFFKNAFISGLFVVALSSILILYLTYIIGNSADRKIGIIASFLLIFNTVFLAHSNFVLSQVPFTFFFIAGLYFFNKGFENEKYFLLSMPLIAMSCLIRFEGYLLIFPMIYLCFKNWSKTKKVIFRDKFLIGSFLGSLFLLWWFIRNYLVFGSFFPNPFRGGDFISYDSWIKTIFLADPILFILFILGGLFLLKKRDEPLLMAFFIWFLGYSVLHSFWTKSIAYVPIIVPIMVLISSYGIINFFVKFKSRNKLKILSLILVLYLIFHSLIFFGVPLWKGSLEINLWDQDFIQMEELSKFANTNLPYEGNYLVPDIAVYSYLDKSHILYYNEGLNKILSSGNFENTFIVADTYHTWMTRPFLAGENGSISMPLDGGKTLVLKTNLIKKVDKKEYYSIILNISEIQIK
ncbi:glycosyltransferase family 39 protein [Candidatus Pacearchaeota archaeon]|nr:glycosyltransferase family 39 protein [Candidatus Pacearchaeota archaeon]